MTTVIGLNLLDRAFGDFNFAREAFMRYTSDEIQLDLIAYHLQQAIEKSLKFILSQNGVTWKFNHRMEDLYTIFINNNLSSVYPAWLKHYWTYLDSFVTETRYGSNIVATLSIITELLPKIDDMLQCIKSNTSSSIVPSFSEYIKYLDSLGLDGKSLLSEIDVIESTMPPTLRNDILLSREAKLIAYAVPYYVTKGLLKL